MTDRPVTMTSPDDDSSATSCRAAFDLGRFVEKFEDRLSAVEDRLDRFQELLIGIEKDIQAPKEAHIVEVVDDDDTAVEKPRKLLHHDRTFKSLVVKSHYLSIEDMSVVLERVGIDIAAEMVPRARKTRPIVPNDRYQWTFLNFRNHGSAMKGLLALDGMPVTGGSSYEPLVVFPKQPRGWKRSGMCVFLRDINPRYSYVAAIKKAFGRPYLASIVDVALWKGHRCGQVFFATKIAVQRVLADDPPTIWSVRDLTTEDEDFVGTVEEFREKPPKWRRSARCDDDDDDYVDDYDDEEEEEYDDDDTD